MHVVSYCKYKWHKSLQKEKNESSECSCNAYYIRNDLQAVTLCDIGFKWGLQSTDNVCFFLLIIAVPSPG